MLDIGWSELLLIGVVALIVVGPKELPVLLRTIGRYVGMVKRQAGEFRAQFDEAIRESEFQEFRDEMESLKSGATSSLNDVEKSIKELETAEPDVDDEPIKPHPDLADLPDQMTSIKTPEGETITFSDDKSADSDPGQIAGDEPLDDGVVKEEPRANGAASVEEPEPAKAAAAT